MPVPIYSNDKKDATFVTLLHSEFQHMSYFNDFGHDYLFSSYTIFLDMDVDHHERKYGKITSLIGEIGA